MKKIILFILLTCLLQQGFSQLIVGTGANWIVTGNPSIVLQDINLVNDGLINGGLGSFRFVGFQNSAISGNATPLFNILEISKTNSAKVFLNRNINISGSINFVSGQLDMNGSNIFLASTAFINNETELNRITGANGGYVQLIQTISSPNMHNPGNLGAFITSTANLGTVTIRRYHTAESGASLTGSINRYYSITATNNSNLNATLRLKYFDAELNGQNENSLVIYQSTDAGATWNNLSRTSNNTNSNYVEKITVESFALQTLSNDNTVAGAVTGLVFTGSRKKATDVQLKWTTQTETNMSGFQVQRKLDTEADFTDRAFVNTIASGGNSSSVLSYQTVDANAHTGLSYYRLKIIDNANNISYSPIISVAGKTKGATGGGNGGGGNGNNRMMDDVAEAKITVGTNPNNGNFWFVVSGIEKETTATLYTIDGKVMKQFKVFNMQQEKIYGLSAGMYLLNVPGMKAVKIIVQ
jgi:hypothetical protein